MKKDFKKIVFILIFLCLNTVAFADIPDPDDSSDPPVPIDTDLYLLIFVGLLFAFYVFKKYRKQKQ